MIIKEMIPIRKPIEAGIQAILPSFSAISIAGINSDQIEAAIMTPAANPSKIFSIFPCNLFFIKKTIADPNVVPTKGINKPNTIFNVIHSSMVVYSFSFFLFLL